MRKFSKILESNKHAVNIKEIFIVFTDKGFDITVDHFQGFYDITLTIKESLNWMGCIKDLSIADDRMLDANLSFVIAKEINLQNRGEIQLKYKLNNASSDKNVNGFKEFKAYCENILGVYGIEGRLNDDSSFRINVASEQEGFSQEEYFGWEIDISCDVEDFIIHYPGYSDFLQELCNRKLDWNGAWERESKGDKVYNPMKFDKEGIEAVEKLLEMAKKFPDKIKITKP